MLKQNAPVAVATFTDTSAGVSGTQVVVLQNTDFNVLVGKLVVTALSGSSPTLDLFLQTSDDGGTTWYDVVRFAQANGAITKQNALFAKFGDLKGSSAYVGQPESQHISAGTVSGLPLLGKSLQCVYTYAIGGGTATVGTAAWTLQILQPDQDYGY